MKVLRYFGSITVALLLCFVINAQQNKATTENSNLMVLSGTVFDPFGSLIVGAKVTATNQKGGKYETVTDNEGRYLLKLPFTMYGKRGGTYDDFQRNPLLKYEIVFEEIGFKKTIIKDFIIVESTLGKMNLDMVLEIRPPDDSDMIEGNPKKPFDKTKINKGTK